MRISRIACWNASARGVPACSSASVRTVNFAANSMGRFNTLTSFMSQWSSRSQADGPDNLARTSVPVLHLTYCADQSVFPSTVRLWMDAAAGRIRNVDIHGGDHYLIGRPDLVDQVADEIAAFARNI